LNFPYSWRMSDGYPAKNVVSNNRKVFGTFICGGGSSMGYKLAGYEHLGGVEIDPRMADLYKANHKPKHLFLEDIRAFADREDFPDDLYDLDILDGSPPCSSFSLSGNREKDWGKEKVFAEGQTAQRLDDLFFDYILLAKKLQPKVVIAENVKGLIAGNAKAYVKSIKSKFEDAGYKVQLFLLNAASMGVPQLRERVFFICQRKDLNFPLLKLKFNLKAIKFGEYRSQNGSGRPVAAMTKHLLANRMQSDKKIADINMRLYKKVSGYTRPIVKDSDVCPTIVASSDMFRHFDAEHFTPQDLQNAGSYPLDYNFKSVNPKYLIGMSVPPVMTAQIAYQIFKQWLSNEDR